MHADFIAHAEQIQVDYAAGQVLPVKLHDGSAVLLRKIDAGYDPTDRRAALARIQERAAAGEHLTGLLYLAPGQPEFHEINGTPAEPLNAIPYARLNPGAARLAQLLARYR